jgi:ComF family protein
MAAFCTGCAATASRAPPLGSDGVAAFTYGGAIATAITRLKYERRPDLARPLADLLWTAVAEHAGARRAEVVVPVPLHPVRLVERGFNQAALLAGPIARHLGVPLVARALARSRDTGRQALLDREGRLANMRGAITARKARRVVGRRVLLVDDVRTTGATLEACAAALREAGARLVVTAVVAAAAQRVEADRQADASGPAAALAGPASTLVEPGVSCRDP